MDDSVIVDLYLNRDETAIKHTSAKYGENAWAGVTKMPVAKINEALICLGVTIEDIKIPAEWVSNM